MDLEGDIKMNEIARKDIHGTPLEEGDIIAEGKLNELIWEGQAKIIQRPLGVINVYKNAVTKGLTMPEETDFYNVTQIRHGLVELTDSAQDFLKANANKFGIMKLHLSRYDGKFYGWENIEKISSVNLFDN